jgi:dienelactone hydrolase
LLFHHAQGLTDGLRALVERLRAVGHTVHTPDMYAGQVFARLDDGVAHAGRIGHDAIEDIARRTALHHPTADTVIGFSLGAFPAQLLAQEWRRVRHCMLIGGAMPPHEIDGEWRHDVRLSIHVADPDDWVPATQLAPLLARAPGAHVHRYQGKGHMFVDPSSADYDADAADLFEERLVEWLDNVTHRAP